MQLTLVTFLLLSLIGNALLAYRLQQKRKRPESYEVKELLSDLLAGGALIEVRRIAAADVFLRSPRQ